MRIQFARNIMTALACAVVLAAAVPLNADGPPRFSPWSTAVKVGPPISSVRGDACPFIAKNDLDLYFRSNDWSRPGYKGGWDIYVSHRDSVDSDWDDPINLPINTAYNEVCSFVTNDGHWLYFVSNRPSPCATGTTTTDLWVSHRQDKRDDQAWEEPKNLGCVVNSEANENGVTLFEDAATGQTFLYFTSNRPGVTGDNDNDIYVSTMVGDDKETFGPPSPLVELNTEYIDAHAFVRRKDGLEMIFVSDRPGTGTMGLTDLWTATRPDTLSPWSTPLPLGANVNSPSQESGPSLSWDGTTLYFYTTREGTYDVYMTTRTKLPD